MSTHYPNWRCKNCNATYDEFCSFDKSPCCRVPLIRWIRYEVKGVSSRLPIPHTYMTIAQREKENEQIYRDRR